MFSAPKRIDLHCHSQASNLTSEAMLNAIHCPESYSHPEEVYAQARRRGMDFVTLTDHDSIEGALSISQKPDVLVSEELTCWFPEDGCKMHVLAFGISPEDHKALQSRAKNIYSVAEYLQANQIAHSVAHPIYRQNDMLERWHVERLLLLFKGFECLNGAHSSLHREAFEPLLDRLTRQEIARLSETHGLEPRWPQPWVKARTGGSDDHGLLNVGRTWTEFPTGTTTTGQILDCLREGNCRAGGEAGSSAKLAHTFYSVAVRYYSRHIMSPGDQPNIATSLLQAIAGERPAPSKSKLAWMGIKHKVRKIFRRSTPASDPVAGTNLLKKLFLTSAWQQFKKQPQIRQTLDAGLPPLGEHEQMFDLVSNINRDVMQGLAAAIDRSIDDASFTGLFDTIGAILAQQFVLLPYYFAVFHQNKERHLLRQITRLGQKKNERTLRVGLFTDTFDEINGVGRFLQDMNEQAQRSGRNLIIHTCAPSPCIAMHGPGRKNFGPLLSREMPYYPQLQLGLPPVLDILEWSDRQQFDAIHISTPGPMGLCGWLASKMLRVPLLATYHTDFPVYVKKLTGDHRISNGTLAYMKWLYGQAAVVFTRSHSYRFNLRDLDVPAEKVRTIPPGINLSKFRPDMRDDLIWQQYGISQPRRLLFCGRVSVEKNLPMLADLFVALSRKRRDVALVIAGEGPYLDTMKQTLKGLPAYFLGFKNDGELGKLYAGSDLFVFPSRTDTLGQVVMEAQACGLPALVSNEGGPKETVEHNITGLVLSDAEPNSWCNAIEELLDDPARRQRMSRAAVTRMSKLSLDQTFDSFWADHLAAVEPQPAEPANVPDVSKISTTL
ncbi:MAG TPA: glycosyltransferase [Tepidisphaeraceae bacterium]|nr:glycosyltransferase [Tepidisphaeraceae bacterium]